MYEIIDKDEQKELQKRRKRINNIKLFIISGILIILFTSVILNIVLIFKVMNLEQRMERLFTSDNYSVTYNRNI